MNRLFFTFCFALILIPPASAQQREYKSGMNHTFVSRPLPTASPAAGTEETSEEETPQSKVWKKYRALASGVDTGEEEDAQTQEQTALPAPPVAPQQPQAASAATQPDVAPATGITAILQDYKRSKDTRREMKSKRLKAPEVDRPVVEKPEVDTPDTL